MGKRKFFGLVLSDPSELQRRQQTVSRPNKHFSDRLFVRTVRQRANGEGAIRKVDRQGLIRHSQFDETGRVSDGRKQPCRLSVEARSAGLIWKQ